MMVVALAIPTLTMHVNSIFIKLYGLASRSFYIGVKLIAHESGLIADYTSRLIEAVAIFISF